ncbi:MAG: oligosaccharide flippase family protein [Chitinophagales bacterium]|nr:oligosaccharide flippase family protein [Chitinophagales bacterium]
MAFVYFARYFEKEVIGIYTVFISLSILLAIPATGRYELAIMLPKKLSEAASLLLIALVLAFLFSLLLALLLATLPLQAYFNKLERLDEFLLLLPIGVFFMASFQSFNIYYNKLGYFKWNAFAKIIQSGGMFAFSIFLGNYFGFSALALILAWVLSHLLSFTLYLVLFIISREKQSLAESFALIKSYKRYPSVSLLSNFLNTLSIELPNYFIPSFWGNSVQALYAYGARIAGMPRNFIAAAVGEVFYSSSSLLAKENKEELYLHLKKITRSLFLFAVSIYALGMLSSWYLFPLVFGAEYKAAVPYFNWLAIASIFLFIQSPISVISDVIGKLKPPLYFTMVSLVCKFSALAFAAYYLANPIHMIALYALVSSALSFFWINYLFKMTKDFKENVI